MTCVLQSAVGQRVLSLDSCRAMAISNNKQLSISRVKKDIAKNVRKSARTKYLPHVSAVGGYMYSSRSISILNEDQKTGLSNIGTQMGEGLKNSFITYTKTLPPLLQTVLTATVNKIVSDLPDFAGALNQKGREVVDAFDTNTHHTLAGGIMVTQPLFMGGAIVSMNRMASIGEQLAENSAEASRQKTLYEIDHVYWQVVSLRHKQKLAQGYLDLVKKLDNDVQKMIREGVATRSDGLSVSVKVNEADMMLTKVEDGLTLSRMLLCQLCGLPVSEKIVLVDEETEDLSATPTSAATADVSLAMSNRPELKMLQNSVDMGKQMTNILKAGNLPQVMLMGGWAGSNPSVYNGFQRRFKGAWNVGVMVRVPLWNWGDVMYKVRAAKGATTIASLEMEEAREMIELQVNQSQFQVNESYKKLMQAQSSIERAEENLRTANLGFQEGVISTTTVMEAQTAWLQAQSQKIDAEIDVKLSQVNLQKSLGVLQ